MYYASIGMLSIIVLIIVNYEALMNSHLEKSQVAKRRYRQFLFGVIVYLLSDIFWGILYGQRLILLAYADTVIYFLSMVVSVFLWTRFVVAYLKNKKAYGKFLIYAGWIITIYEVIVLSINFFTPIVFGFNDDKEYVPGRSRYVTLFIQMFLFFLTSLYSFIVATKSEDEDKRHHKTIGFSGIAMTIFIALQSLYPLMPFYAVGCLLATCMIHTFVYKDETVTYAREIGTTKQLAYRDALTGVKNRMAYLEKLKDLEIHVEDGTIMEYAVAVFDVNDLKKVNDTLGHEEGDRYLKEACKFICLRFKYSPVFRIGGDEFAVILEELDYRDRDEIMRGFDEDVDKNQRDGLVVVAGGISVFDPESDESYNDVFMRADRKMYERKEFLKGRAKSENAGETI
jgi:diguanylate cyclase (GGDEF)-like protein